MASSRHQRPTVVVADDVHSARILLRTTLEPEFDIVAEAHDEEQALAFCAQLRPDAVVLDLDMPRRSSVDPIGAIRRRAPGTAVLVLSAVTSARESLGRGADCFVDKAAPLYELRDGLRALIGP